MQEAILEFLIELEQTPKVSHLTKFKSHSVEVLVGQWRPIMYSYNVRATYHVESSNQMTLVAVIVIKLIEFGVLASYTLNRLLFSSVYIY